jgi:putative peptide zinc metalloprotease protein
MVTLQAPATPTAKEGAPPEPIYFGPLGGQDPGKTPLPGLRDDLQLLPGPTDRGGAPTWTIYDPVRHRYHRLTLAAFEMLQRWDAGTFGRLCERMKAETLHETTLDDCAQLVRFLRVSGLVDLSSPKDLGGWKGQVDASRPPLWRWLLHNYLFIRIPLVRPQRWLAKAWPFVKPLYSALTLWVLLGLLSLGLYLVSRQWDSFIGGFATYASWEGLVWTGITLVCAKIIHELGHAFTAYRYGCRVATMGVAFLVLMPVLYTDTSDSWRLPSHRQRLAIGVAGIAAELALAIVATVIWSFLPDGAARSAVFIIASASWVTTLSINLSPFMRFDGYYLLSDLWQIPNLQNRAFAYARWWMREKLFGFGDPMPELWQPSTRRGLLLYAFGTWVYRLLLFIGIAVLVYHVTFKLLGILLFMVEIMWFVGSPILSELRVWWARRNEIHARPRTLAAGGALLALLALVAIPWNRTIPLPATLESAQSPSLYAPQGAQVAEIHVTNGSIVQQGDPLIILRSPDLEAEITQATYDVLQARLSVVQAAALRERAEDRLALELTLDRTRQRLDSLRQDQARLTITAPISGQVVDIPPELSPGEWISAKAELGQMVTPNEPGRVIAYANDEQSQRFSVGAEVTFHQLSPLSSPLQGTVTAIETVNIQSLPSAYLAATQGGPIAVLSTSSNQQNHPRPTTPLYRVYITLSAPPPAPLRIRTGTATITGTPQSLLSHAWRSAASVLVRESGF